MVASMVSSIMGRIPFARKSNGSKLQGTEQHRRRKVAGKMEVLALDGKQSCAN